MSIFVGADAGGSKTSVVVADDKKILAEAGGPPGAVRPGRALQAAGRIAATVRKALTQARLLQADVLVVGAAGVGREPERTELRESLRGEHLADRTIVTGDLDIAIAAAFGEGPGIVLLSGTGSVAVARKPDGALERRGGYGWQMGDEGSGYAVGRAALEAIGRAQDRRAPETALATALAAGRSFDELVRWSTSAEPGEVAALAPRVFAAAEAGDLVAREIVSAAAQSLADLVTALVPLFPGTGPVPLALAGGNLAPERGLRSPVLERLKKPARLKLRDGPLDPALGALALARKAGSP